MAGLGAHYAGPGLMLSFVLSGMGCAFAGLCYAEFAAMIPLAGSAYTYAYATLGEIFAWIIGWDLTLEYAMGASTVSSGWSNHFIELLDIFHIKMPLWLAYDHWTALATAQDIIARQMAHAADPSLVPGTQAFLQKVSAIIDAQSPALVQQAHGSAECAPYFRRGDRLQSAGVPDRPDHHRHPGGRDQRERALQRHHRSDQGIGGAVRDRAGRRLISTRANWGHDWSSFAPYGFSGIGAGAAYIFFAYIGFDAVSTTAQEAKNPQRDLPIGIIASLLDLHGSVYCRGRRAHRHGAVARRQYRSAHRARFPRSRTDRRLAHHHAGRPGRPYQRHAGDAAGPDSRAVFHGQ